MRGRVLFTGDWHLDARTFGMRREFDVQRSAMAIVDIAKNEGVGVVVHLGDLCDPDRDEAPRHASFAIEWTQQLQAVGIAVIWLVGNHDVIEDGSGTSTLEPIGKVCELVKRPRVLTAGCVSFLGLPFVERSATYDPASFLGGGYDVVIGHLTVPGYSPGSESGDMARGRDILFPSRWAALLVNGHYHAQHGAPVYTPGSLVRLRVDEAQNKTGVLLWDVGSSAPWRVAIPSREIVDFDFTAKAWTTKSTLKQDFRDKLVRLRVPHAEGARATLIEQIVKKVESEASGIKIERPRPDVIAASKDDEQKATHRQLDPRAHVEAVIRRGRADEEIVERAVQVATSLMIGAGA